MEESLLILFFAGLVLVFLAGAFVYLRTLRAQSRRERELREATLDEMREQLRQIELKLARLQLRLDSSVTLPSTESASRPVSLADIRTLVEAELARLGFSKIHLLLDSDFSSLAPREGQDWIEIPLEAIKDNVRHKGRAILRNGSLVECRMQPSYEVFP